MVIKNWPSALRVPSDPKAIIWRYMDFTKFVAMLSEGALFFPSAELFDDPFEGSIGHDKKRIRESLLDEFYPGEVAKEQGNRLADLGRWNRQFTFINCWHLNESESAAMWKLYTQSNEAIAIQSTYEQLRNSLPNTVHVYQVNYIDYRTESIPDGHSLYPFFHKRKSFEHEKELRAIISGLAPDAPRTNVISVPVALDQLIARIHLAPTSPSWFGRLVGNVCTRYGLDKEVLISAMEDAPFF